MPNAGFIPLSAFAGWLILLDYILVPSLLYIVSAAALAPMLPGVPGWLWIVGFIAINSLINLRGITFTARANNTILIAEIVVLSVFVVLGLIALYSGAGAGHLTLDPLYNADKFSLPLVMGAVSIAVLSFLGFDGISTLSEETKGGVDTVGKASLGALMLVGSLFILQTWIAADLAQGMTFSSLDTAFYDTANLAGGNWLKYVTMWSTVISGDSQRLGGAGRRVAYSVCDGARQAAAAAAGESASAAENALRQHPVCGADFAGFRPLVLR